MKRSILIAIIFFLYIFPTACGKNRLDTTIHTEEDASDYLLAKLIDSGYDTEGTDFVPEPFIADQNWFSEKNNVWYFAWGKSTEEMLTAEKYFAVTDDWEFWEYDGVNHTWLTIAQED